VTPASEMDVTTTHEAVVEPGFLPVPGDDVLAADRKVLLQLCLYALDRARSSGVAERIEDGLAQVGVTAIRPDGERFDPAYHEAGGTVPTGDPALDGTVAETEAPGFHDRGQLLRAPLVTVYTVRSTS
jgi:molecular chaperone GrpE